MKDTSPHKKSNQWVGKMLFKSRKKNATPTDLIKTAREMLLPTLLGMGSYAVPGLVFNNIKSPLHRGLATLGIVALEGAVVVVGKNNKTLLEYMPITILGTAIRAAIDLGEAAIPDSNSGSFSHLTRKVLGLTLKSLPGTPVVSVDQQVASAEVQQSAPAASILETVVRK